MRICAGPDSLPWKSHASAQAAAQRRRVGLPDPLPGMMIPAIIQAPPPAAPAAAPAAAAAAAAAPAGEAKEAAEILNLLASLASGEDGSAADSQQEPGEEEEEQGGHGAAPGQSQLEGGASRGASPVGPDRMQGPRGRSPPVAMTTRKRGQRSAAASGGVTAGALGLRLHGMLEDVAALPAAAAAGPLELPLGALHTLTHLVSARGMGKSISCAGAPGSRSPGSFPAGRNPSPAPSGRAAPGGDPAASVQGGGAACGDCSGHTWPSCPIHPRCGAAAAAAAGLRGAWR